jgi:Ulp1 family protease
LIKKGKTKIGIIFNLDPHYLEGSHWISMFINVKKGYIFFFDSNGEAAPAQVKKLANRIIKQGKEIGLNLEFYQNHPKEHQKGNTECGMYSLYLIIQLLTGTHDYKFFMNERVPDKNMQELRKEYFN